MIHKEVLERINEIKDPFDKFFGIAFSYVQITRTYLEVFMPAEEQALLDLDTLTLDNSSYRNEAFKDFAADLVYTCELKQEAKTTTKKRIAKIVFIFEHKSYKTNTVHFQVLQYKINRWLEDNTQKRKKVLNIPVLIYHGNTPFKKMWLVDYFDEIPKPLQKYFPDFKILTTDLTIYDDKVLLQMIGKSMLLNTFLALKHSRDPAYILHNLEKLLTFIEEHLKIDRDLAGNFFKSLILFLLRVLPKTKQQEFPNIVTKLSKNMEKGFKSIYDAIIEEANQRSDKLEELLEEANQKAEKERQRAERERQRAERERQKVEKEQKETEKERQRAERTTIKFIKHLAFNMNYPIERIAKEVGVSPEFVAKAIQNK